MTRLPDPEWDAFIAHEKRTRLNPARTVLINTLAAIAATAVFFMVLHLADRDAGDASRMARINAELDAADARLQRAATQLCQAEAGPGAEALWTQDGDLVCRPAVLTAIK